MPCLAAVALQPAGDAVAALADALVDRLVVPVAARLAAIQRGLFEASSSAFTPDDYELSATSILPRLLSERCGLRVVSDVATTRLEGEIPSFGAVPSVEWDFRAPVTVDSVPASRPSKASDFHIYPDRSAYIRPSQPSSPRNLTPTTHPLGSAPPACHFMAVFEVTTADNWNTKPRAGGSSFLQRLEERLFVSVERAKAAGATGPTGGAGLSVLDVVAVVGVVSPHVCEQSMAASSTLKGSGFCRLFPMLSAMRDAGRFVCFKLPYATDVSPHSALKPDGCGEVG